VAGEVLLRKGHIERDCLRRASIATCCNVSEGAKCEYSLNGKEKEVFYQTSLTRESMRSETGIPDEASRIRCDDRKGGNNPKDICTAAPDTLG